MKPEDMDQEFLEFLNHHQSVLRRMCRVYAHSLEDREDLFQEMVYQLWRSYPTFRQESSRGTWLYRVALNTALSALRRRTRTEKHVTLENEMGAAAPEPRGKESGQVEMLYRMIRRLNKVDRALVLLYLEDLSYQELGNILGLSESNVGVKLNRIKARLQSFAKEME